MVEERKGMKRVRDWEMKRETENERKREAERATYKYKEIGRECERETESRRRVDFFLGDDADEGGDKGSLSRLC